MHTAIHNNLKVHFIKRLLRFINLTTPTYESGLTKDEVKSERKLLKDALFANDESLVPDRYKAWYASHRPRCLPSSWEVSLPYDTKANSSRYLGCSLYMNKCLEEQGCKKLFQPLSLRTSIVPHYATFDTASLISFFAERGEKGKRYLSPTSATRFWHRGLEFNDGVLVIILAQEWQDVIHTIHNVQMDFTWFLLRQMVQRVHLVFTPSLLVDTFNATGRCRHATLTIRIRWFGELRIVERYIAARLSSHTLALTCGSIALALSGVVRAAGHASSLLAVDRLRAALLQARVALWTPGSFSTVLTMPL